MLGRRRTSIVVVKPREQVLPMELLQLIRLPLDPLHLLCQPLAELDPGWGRAGA